MAPPNATIFKRIIIVLVPLAIIVGFFWWYVRYDELRKKEQLIEQFCSLQVKDITSFIVFPVITPSDDYKEIEFIQNTELVKDFFLSIADNQPYSPDYERLTGAWGIKIKTHTTQFEILCYISKTETHVIVGFLSPETEPSFPKTLFKSKGLLEWYVEYAWDFREIL